MTMKWNPFNRWFNVDNEIKNAYKDYFKECGYKDDAPKMITEELPVLEEPRQKSFSERMKSFFSASQSSTKQQLENYQNKLPEPQH